MPCDYISLKAENEKRYGTDIGRIGRMLLADRYDKRTHFIFELLQNSEDALRRRRDWTGSRAVKFDLMESRLRISHRGAPFDERDVRGICGIDESTKDITAIGRFGIGFKSVYAFTDRPEVHSGDEAFAIESYVWPVAVEPIDRNSEDTVILLPLKIDDIESVQEIAGGLEQLGARSLLFLRHVNEISWSADGGASGLYLRGDPEWLGENVRLLALLGEQHGKENVEERWLVFAREVLNQGASVGHVEIAYSIDQSDADGWFIRPSPDAPLVVFFPTVLETHVGFLAQGPYRTTPSRDNIPQNDSWNQHLVAETTQLVLDSLRWLKERGKLDTGTLMCMPLDASALEKSLFAPMFNSVVSALQSEPLLPDSRSCYVSGNHARLSRTQDLRDLFQPEQLGQLLGAETPVSWLSSDITADRTPRLRQYLLYRLKVPELTPELIAPRLSKTFLENQTDEWIVRLYGFLANVPALTRQGRLEDAPLVRLEDGSHVPAFRGNQPQAFLPTTTRTEFPTARRAVSAKIDAKRFLTSLGLTEPDPVDDVIRNILPRYSGGKPNLSAYADDIGRIVRAFSTDSKAQREKLIAALRRTRFVAAVNTGTGTSVLATPDSVYLASARLKELFADVSGLFIVDDSYDCLRGEDVREMLEASGGARYILPVSWETYPPATQLRDLRREAGCENCTYDISLLDYTLRGLDELLDQLPLLKPEEKARKAELLWEALIELQDRRGQIVFIAVYSWMYFQARTLTLDSRFVRILNQTPWIPDPNGELQTPGEVLFEKTGWRTNPVLLNKIAFKKPIVEELAREVGIEPGVFDLLKRFGITSEADLVARLGLDSLTPQTHDTPDPLDRTETNSATSRLEVEQPSGLVGLTTEQNQIGTTNAAATSSDQQKRGDGTATAQPANRDGENGQKSSGGSARQADSRNGGERRFVSYVASHPETEDQDPDGLAHEERMALEARAVSMILEREPTLQIMPSGNKGFDLLDADLNGEPERWIEVKAMTGSLSDRPVGLSSVQFEFARVHGDQYWLYVVEHTSDARARILKIQNPAGRTGTFTFDGGWASVAIVEQPQPGPSTPQPPRPPARG